MWLLSLRTTAVKQHCHPSDASQEDNVPAGCLLPSKPHAVPFSCCYNARVIAGPQCICSSLLQGQAAMRVSDVSGRLQFGEAHPSSLRSEGGQMFVHSADVSIIIRCLFRGNCATTWHTVQLFHSTCPCEFLFVWLSCLHVYFFFKGTLASHMIIDDVFHITIFPPGSAISLSLETQLPSHPRSCTPAPFLLP